MPAHRAKIRDIFLVFAAPDRAPILTADDFEPDVTHVFFLAETGSKSGIAAAKYGSQDTVAGLCRAWPACDAQSDSLALRAGFSRNRDGLRMVPIKIHEFVLS